MQNRTRRLRPPGKRDTSRAKAYVRRILRSQWRRPRRSSEPCPWPGTNRKFRDGRRGKTGCRSRRAGRITGGAYRRIFRQPSRPGSRVARLEIQASGELAGTVAACAGELAKQRAGDGRIDATECVTVEYVKEFDAQLPAEALLEAHVLGERNIFTNSAASRGRSVGGSPGAQRERRGLREQCLVEIRIGRRTGVGVVESLAAGAGHELSGSDIIAIGCAIPPGG